MALTVGPKWTDETAIGMLRTMLPLVQFSTDRPARNRSTDIRIGCRWSAVWNVQDSVLEDSAEYQRDFFGNIVSMYWSAHRAPVELDTYTPALTCGHCRHVVEVLEFAKMGPNEQLEHAERMAVVWMERAQAARKA